MTHRSKSTLFLIEQLIVIAVFAICAVACISILTAAYFNAIDTKATNHSIIIAESSAEVFKAVGGDPVAVADFLGGTTVTGATGAVVMVYYDSTWQVCSRDNASFVLSLVVDAHRDPGDYSLVTGRLSIERVTEEELISLTIAARGRPQEVSVN